MAPDGEIRLRGRTLSAETRVEGYIVDDSGL